MSADGSNAPSNTKSVPGLPAGLESKDIRWKEFEGHKVGIIDAPGGRGYYPVTLIDQGRFSEAAAVAARAFRANLR